MRPATAAGAALAVVLWGATAPAGQSQVMVERRADGTLLMLNKGGPRRAAASRRPRSEIGMIDTHARRQSLDPELVRAVVLVESGYDPAALSRKGAMGLMQLMPATARSLDVGDPYDPEENLRAGTTYLRRMLDRFGKHL